MPIYTFNRLCPTDTLTFNNHWYTPVKPKKAIFFLDYELPYQREHTKMWVDFLKTTHHRKVLYLHTLKLEASRIRRRVLTTWKGVDLVEVILPLIYWSGHKELVKTVRV